ncbi:MAG: type IV secretion system DNA-binding domain-containing protein [Desulfatitalea sp.]|nr:type IV secretion system DNA-binding domain-containing protein [Desulfatitalea sp.]NNJ98996.1 type IV secretion system DNA-binding domain-containing protein [Desulfatitalea sp.]
MAKGKAYESFEILTSAVRMDAKMHARIFMFLIVVHAALFIGISAATWHHNRSNAISYWAAKAAMAIKLPDAKINIFNANGSKTKTPIKTIVGTTGANAQRQSLTLLYLLLGTSPVYLLHGIVVKKLGRTSEQRDEKEYIRGSKLITTDAFWDQVKEQKMKASFPLGEIAMPEDNETRGTMMIGGPGTGKTQATRWIIKEIKKRLGHGLIYDYKGDYISEFYDPDTDLLFNVVDKRCLGWRLFNDIESITDLEALAHSLVPTPAQGSGFWEEGARSLFAAGLRHNYKHKQLSNMHLWDFLSAPTGKMKEILADVKGVEAALKFLGDSKESRQADGFQAVLMQYCKCFEYMAGIGGDFSIKKWVENGSGLVFVTNYESIRHTLRPIMSLFIDTVIRTLLSMPDSKQRRFYTVLDEFGTLNKLNIQKLSTAGRSKGSVLVMATQDRKQPINIYGRDTVDSMDEALKNRIIFSVEGESAEYESKKRIKETEYRVWERSVSMGPDDHRDGVNLSPKKYVEPLFLPADIARLKDLTGIVKLQNFDFVVSRWKYDKPQPRHEQLSLREDLSLAYLEEQELRQAEAAAKVDISFVGEI